jgi:hypothetical protein
MTRSEEAVMASLCKSFSSTESARRAAEALSAAGVPARDIGVLIGFQYHDVRVERIGGFGGPVDPDAPVGKYTGPPRPRWRAAGGFTAHADDLRQGSYADVERTLSVTRENGDEHVRVTDDDSTRRLLSRAHLPDDVARRVVRQLHDGQAVVFAAIADIDAHTAETLIGARPGVSA